MIDVNCEIKKIVSRHAAQAEGITEVSSLEELKISSLEFIKLSLIHI